MNININSYIIAALTNIIIFSLAQAVFWSMPREANDTSLFQFLIVPLITMLINTILWFSKFKLKFAEPSFFVVFLISAIVSLFVGDVTFTNNTGNLSSFILYKSEDGKDPYVTYSIPINTKADSGYWYKMECVEMYKFLVQLAEKTPS